MSVFITEDIEIGSDKLVLLSGPCAVEDYEICFEVANSLKQVCEKLGIAYIFKASFDKANRTSAGSFRSIGVEESLDIFRRLKKELQIPIVTDVHEDTPMDEVAEVADVLQTPAFLCRQTNFIQKVADKKHLCF